jgi:predicted phosphodiesterase
MGDGELLFVQLADIHFTKWSGDHYDLDEDLRNELLRDVEHGANGHDQPSGILVCGDIAFGGKRDEYEKASVFLKELCGHLHVPETAVFCVPGNHDVDHAYTENSVLLCDIQANIHNDDSPDQCKLRGYCRDTLARDLVFGHIHEYNKFAGKFSCNIDANRPCWQQRFALNDGSQLGLVGLNSVIPCNHVNNDEGQTVLGEFQVPRNEAGVTLVCLCHHPPECWRDSDTGTRLNERVRVQLYGHKHKQRVRKTENTLIIGSGAAHPVRRERNWKPRYNWIAMSVEYTDGNRVLRVRIYPRVLDDRNDHFMLDVNNCEGRDCVERYLTLEGCKGVEAMPLPETRDEGGTEQESKIPEAVSNPKRTLVYRFLELSFLARSRILSELSLIGEEDEGVDHINLIETIMAKAEQAHLLGTMWERISVERGDDTSGDNPFTCGDMV